MNQDQKNEVTQKLQTIVDNFNKEFYRWKEETGCVASFLWGYPADEKKNLQIREIQTMEINAIDSIVFRRPAPTSEELLKAMNGKS